MPSLPEWMHEQSVELLELDNLAGSARFKRFISQLRENAHLFQYGPSLRQNDFAVLKYTYPVASTYVIGLINVIHVAEKKETYVGDILWRENADEPEYVCAMATYRSQEGEYRGNFTTYTAFNDAYDKYSEKIDPIAMRLLELVTKGEIVIEAMLVPCSGVEDIAEQVDSKRLAIRIAAVSLLFSEEESTSPHLRENYKEVMSFLREKCEDLLGEIDRRAIVSLRFGADNDLRVRSGKKLSPLTRQGTIKVGNVRDPTWREEFVTRKFSDMKLNGLTAAPPFYNNWAYLSESHAHTFENEAMHSVYNDDAVARMALKKLREARGELQQAEEDNRGLVDYYDHKLYQTILASEELLLLGDVTHMLFVEHVGSTLGSLPPKYDFHYPTRGEIYEKEFGERSLTKVLFDLCYGCLNLHKIAVHGDLHFNNCTVHRRWGINAPRTPKEPCILYATGEAGEADAYLLPSYNMEGHIIDFGRGVITPALRPELEQEMSPEEVRSFYYEQGERILHIIARWYPHFAKEHQEKIKGLALSDQQALYDALRAVDYLSLAVNIGAVFDPGFKGTEHWSPAKRLRDRCQRIEDTARRELFEGLNRAILGATEKPRKNPPPGTNDSAHRILYAGFGDFLFPKWDPLKLRDLTIVDAFNATVPMKYNGDDPKHFPPPSRADELSRISGLPVEKLLDRGSEALERTLRDERRTATLDLLVERERRRVEGAPENVLGKTWL